MRSLRREHLDRLLSKYKKYIKKNVLDIGGWDFCLTVLKRNIPFELWTVVEYDLDHFLFMTRYN